MLVSWFSLTFRPLPVPRDGFSLEFQQGNIVTGWECVEKIIRHHRSILAVRPQAIQSHVLRHVSLCRTGPAHGLPDLCFHLGGLGKKPVPYPQRGIGCMMSAQPWGTCRLHTKDGSSFSASAAQPPPLLPTLTMVSSISRCSTVGRPCPPCVAGLSSGFRYFVIVQP